MNLPTLVRSDYAQEHFFIKVFKINLNTNINYIIIYCMY